MFKKMFPTLRHSAAFGLMLMTAGLELALGISGAGSVLVGGGVVWIFLA